MSLSLGLIAPPYESLKFRCEVDYAWFEVVVNERTNFRKVKSLTGATFVEALDALPSHAARHFRIRFDELSSRSQAQMALGALAQHAGGFTQPPQLCEIEVALDAIAGRSREVTSWP